MGDWWNPDFIPQLPEDYDEDDFNFSELGLLEAKYVWNTWGDNCPICDSLRGTVQTMDFWINCGLYPGFHIGCDCTLKRVSDDTPVSDPDIFGTHIAEYADMYMPGANIFWDTSFEFGSWISELREEATAAYEFFNGELPIGEAWKRNPPTNKSSIFRQVHPYWNNILGWRVLQQRRYLENIDGQFQGDRFWDGSNLANSALDPFVGWFLTNWKNPQQFTSYKDQFNRYIWPSGYPSGLRPVALKPYLPFQSYATEVD